MQIKLMGSSIVALSAVSTAFAGINGGVNVGPTAYLSLNDSPWRNDLGFRYENFEDNNFNLLGTTIKEVDTLVLNWATNNLADSVDGDDESINGLGHARSLFRGNGGGGISFVFSPSTIGFAPTRAGVVFTDGAGATRFQAWNLQGQLIADFTGTSADGSYASTTGEDRFYGVEYAGGIGEIRISNVATGVGIEVDHVQYSNGAIPTPGAGAVLGMAMLGVGRRRR